MFGVPAFEVDGKLFWGSMVCPCCARIWRETPGLDGPQWDAVAQVPSGLAPAAKG